MIRPTMPLDRGNWRAGVLFMTLLCWVPTPLWSMDMAGFARDQAGHPVPGVKITIISIGDDTTWGGADVHDVLNLTAVAKSLGYIDMERLFMLGVSRGGMMTYLALKNKVPVRAAAVIAGPSALEPLAALRSDFLNGDDGYDGWAKVWPDFEHKKEDYFRERSAIAWADQINTPKAKKGKARWEPQSP